MTSPPIAAFSIGSRRRNGLALEKERVESTRA
jgi:hypothetical protein